MLEVMPIAERKASSWRRKRCRSIAARMSFVLFFVAYVSLGAYVFLLIESSGTHSSDPLTEEIKTSVKSSGSNPSTVATPQQEQEQEQLQELMTHQLLERLWDITESLNILYKENWTQLASYEITKVHDAMMHSVHHCRDNIDDVQDHHDDDTPTAARTLPPIHPSIKWNYPMAFLYSLSVITTLGSCPLIPTTNEGKLLTIVYAAFGIPLLLFYLTMVGSALTSCFSPAPSSSGSNWSSKSSRKKTRPILPTSSSSCDLNKSNSQQQQQQQQERRRRRTMSQDPISLEFNPHDPPSFCIAVDRIRSCWPILFCLMAIVVYIGGGAWLFTQLTSMALTDAVFLSFMLFTTMGIPDATDASIWSQPTAVVAVAVYIFLALNLCSLCFNLLYEWLICRSIPHQQHHHHPHQYQPRSTHIS